MDKYEQDARIPFLAPIRRIQVPEGGSLLLWVCKPASRGILYGVDRDPPEVKGDRENDLLRGRLQPFDEEYSLRTRAHSSLTAIADKGGTVIVIPYPASST